jgi:hypothetical protein
LDGAELELPAHVTAVVTTDRHGQSYYVLDDTAGAWQFAGLDEIGATMAGFMKAFTAAARGEREAIEAASAPVGCGHCGRTFANNAAYTVHQDRGRCLPDGAHGQLVNVDGAWCSAWRYPNIAPQ